MLASRPDHTVHSFHVDLLLFFFFKHLIWGLCFSRFVLNNRSTCCLMVTSRMQSVSCLSLKVGGMGRSQQFRIRGQNLSRPTGVCWIISSGVTKSVHNPTLVSGSAASHPKHLLFTWIPYTTSCVMSHCHLLVRPSYYSGKKRRKVMRL